ncbi:Uncharacterized protein YtpQ, UPF0354 family [Gracilibacillus ureilyticus]|uniref:UPF0354 protein SAMN04487944_113118 n=1 Tax=Gracilibacillus ureilyticus TaxID=531814 RepID=A0A1H9TDB7_9BACI|nr:DUF1444 domain-containing protein [Gracilibacillus ureilyticus]SER95096.1 Uncharacterized protein YtpQ, UPF0354 family [Gracilibacillus ureilyticus]
MKMTTLQMKKKLDELFQREDWRVSFIRDKDVYRVEWKDTKQGVSIRIPNVIAKYEQRGEAALDELQFHVTESLKMMNQQHHLTGKEKHIFPVIRATSFPKKSKAGIKLVYTEHTAETNIYYALDLGSTYQLIDEKMLQEQGWTKDRLKEISLFNVRSLPIDSKKDTVAENDFYFVSPQDGYDASRILNESFLEEMKANAVGELVVAVPHQDVLIVADIKNETGYDIIAQMTMKFFAEGRVPITSLPFVYDEKKLEPVFILAKNRPKE